eukprot:scpid90394/ scgid31472/ 
MDSVSDSATADSEMSPRGATGLHADSERSPPAPVGPPCTNPVTPTAVQSKEQFSCAISQMLHQVCSGTSQTRTPLQDGTRFHRGRGKAAHHNTSHLTPTQMASSEPQGSTPSQHFPGLLNPTTILQVLLEVRSTDLISHHST